MFYCDPCAVDLGYPQSIFRSRGACELCHTVGGCNDIQSSRLPEPKPEGWAKVRVREAENEKLRKEADLKKSAENKEPDYSLLVKELKDWLQGELIYLQDRAHDTLLGAMMEKGKKAAITQVLEKIEYFRERV